MRVSSWGRRSREESGGVGVGTEARGGARSAEQGEWALPVTIYIYTHNPPWGRHTVYIKTYCRVHT